ncbi:uncharacterized protein PFL1_02356 [Pseudozyma flocculosa PF-1]|uniref:DNA helicase n=1 Tax=Pseudozyma flocculosa TaxID=84751 RepID=A0A5C3F822_9BASI|nr:uncharacterized protein PFL1_02356 [Pseudozyma flocculosa PF-1]EPQ30240.1 hypothetical protein PFL1_02356 [Pseudozyma flocculosa PF-1]SPO39825.1 related to HCS1 - DNA helicase A [Pseudozyma flocculosa]
MPTSSAHQLHGVAPPSQDLLRQWLQRHLDLLQTERDEEQRQSKLLLSKTPPKVLEHNGLALLGLGVAGIRIGLGAKMLIELERPSAYHTSTAFPAHSFRPGDLAEIQDHSVSTVAEPSSKSSTKSAAKSKTQPIQGVVYRVSDSRIVLAVGNRKRGSGKAKAVSQSAAAASGANGDAKSDKRDARSGDSTKVSGDELEIPERVRLVKVANEATYDRMERTLTRLAKALGVNVKASGSGDNDSSDDDDDDDEPAADGNTVSAPRTASGATALIRTLLGLERPAFAEPPVDLPLPPFNDRLNASQLQAIRFALSAKQVALIHGPPGTGKTTAIVELIMQLVAGNLGVPAANDGAGARDTRGVRILVCGASNLAVDNLLERIVGRPEHREALKKRGAGGLTRLGHPARVLASLHASTLDAQSSTSSEGQLVSDVATELSSALAALRPPSAANTAGNKSVRSQPRLKGNERRQRWEEVRQLRKEYRQRERGVTRAILDRAQIVVATCHGAGGKQLAGREFDVVIIDEACQALEAVCWVPILKVREGGKVILAGDHLQLPPTVKSLKKGDGHRSARKEKGKGAKKQDKQTESKDKTKDGSATGGESDAKAKDDEAQQSSGDDDEEDVITTFEVAPHSGDGDKTTAPQRTTQLRPPRTLETTLFSRLLGMYGPGLKTLLSIQYRMNSDIMAFPNLALYESRLEAHDSCRSISVRDLDNFVAPPSRSRQDGEDGQGDDEEEVETAKVVFYDTAGCEMYETSSSDQSGDRGPSTAVGEGSKSNYNEADLVLRHISLLVARGIRAEQITVLSPYSAQVSLISSLLRTATFPPPPPLPTDGGGSAVTAAAVNGEAIEVGTIDGMQGREKDVVIISLVRSNENGQVGFLDEKRRLNVAMTRAKRQLVVVGDSETVAGQGGYLKQWMDWLDENALVESVVTLSMD